MTTLTTLLVGTHFYVPGKNILPLLPSGTRVLFQPEPENPYDAEAIKVLLQCEALLGHSEDSDAEIREALLGTGWDLHDLLERSPIQLGHVGKTGGKPLERAGIACGNREFLDAFAEDAPMEGTLMFDGQGRPLLRLDV
jgi:hypothetical protein